MTGDRRIVVIGAGVAGLTAAYHLIRAGRQVVVLEGRDRIGGRVHTQTGQDGIAPIELGAEFLHGEKVETWRLVHEACLETREVLTRRWLAQHGKLVQDDAFYEQLDAITERIPISRPDCSCLEFLENTLDDSAASLFREYVEGFHAADPKKMSLQAFAKSEQAAETEGTQQFRMVRGYDSLVDWLGAQVRAGGGQIVTQTIAKHVHWQPRTVEVHAETDAGEQVFAGCSAIVTIPILMLTQPGRAHLRFEPELAGKTAALTGLEMGHVIKLVFECNTRIWPTDVSGFLHRPNVSLPTWWTDEQALVLTGWAGGPRAEQMSRWNEEQLWAEAVRILAQFFSSPPGTINAAIKQMHAHSWTQDPFSGGAYSYIRVGALDAPQQLAEPVADTIFLAGEATADPGEQGTVHGAIQSGRRAAEAFLHLTP